MPSVNKSVLVPFTSAQMFALVDAVEDYPQFLPWCGGVTLHSRNADETVATLKIGYANAAHAFTTRNRKIANESMTIALVDGPFSELQGAWTFVALGDDGCKVSFQLTYQFSNSVIEAVIGGVFEMIGATLIDRFVSRAETIYRQPL